MGILDKVKNLFTEEIEEEPVVKKETKIEARPEVKREIQKEVRKVEIAPARRESKVLLDDEKEDIISESPALKKEEKSVLPIYFSDEDFEDLEKPKKEERPVKDLRSIREAYQGRREEPKKEEKKVFKPSPVISPVYGVLDKNYKKDDITTKPSPSVTYYKSDKVTIDDIRNKAFGTLEDDLESNLFNDPIVVENEIKEDIGLDIFEELENTENKRVDLLREDFKPKEENIETADLSEELEKQKQRIEEINEIIKGNIAPSDSKENTSKKLDNILDELDEIEEELTPNKEEMNIGEKNEDTNDELVEEDLFNLIDSMYETRDE